MPRIFTAKPNNLAGANVGVEGKSRMQRRSSATLRVPVTEEVAGVEGLGNFGMGGFGRFGVCVMFR